MKAVVIIIGALAVLAGSCVVRGAKTPPVANVGLTISGAGALMFLGGIVSAII